MHARSYHDCSSNRNFFGARAEVRNDGHFTVISSQSLANDGFADPVLAVRSAKPLQQLGAVGVGVRITVRKEHFVVIVLELNCES